MVNEGSPVSLLTAYEGDIYSFTHESYNFIVEFDSETKTWSAFLIDEDSDEEIVLETPEQEFVETDIFGYIMKEDEFSSLKNMLFNYVDEHEEIDYE